MPTSNFTAKLLELEEIIISDFTSKNVNIKCDTFLFFFYPIFLTSSVNNSPAVLYLCIRRG